MEGALTHTHTFITFAQSCIFNTLCGEEMQNGYMLVCTRYRDLCTYLSAWICIGICVEICVEICIEIFVRDFYRGICMGFSIEFKLFFSIQMSIELCIGVSVCVRERERGQGSGLECGGGLGRRRLRTTWWEAFAPAPSGRSAPHRVSAVVHLVASPARELNEFLNEFL